MKKLITFGLLLCLSMSLIACGKKEEQLTQSKGVLYEDLSKEMQEQLDKTMEEYITYNFDNLILEVDGKTYDLLTIEDNTKIKGLKKFGENNILEYSTSTAIYQGYMINNEISLSVGDYLIFNKDDFRIFGQVGFNIHPIYTEKHLDLYDDWHFSLMGIDEKTTLNEIHELLGQPFNITHSEDENAIFNTSKYRYKVSFQGVPFYIDLEWNDSYDKLTSFSIHLCDLCINDEATLREWYQPITRKDEK